MLVVADIDKRKIGNVVGKRHIERRKIAKRYEDYVMI